MSEEEKDTVIMTGVGKDGALVTTDPNDEPEAEPKKEPEEPAAEEPEKTEEPEPEADPEKKSEEETAAKEEPETEKKEEETEETPATEEETEEVEVVAEAEKGPPPKKKDGFQKRVDKLTHDKRILKEENARLRAAQAQPVAVQEVVETEAPKESDFSGPDGYEKFHKAEVKFEAKQVYREEKAKEAEAAEQARVAKVVFDFEQRKVAALERYPDWEEVSAASRSPIPPPAVANLIHEHEAGPDILYYLAKNPEVAEKLWQMSPVSAVAEVGKLAASLTSSPAKKGKPPSESSEKSAKYASNATPPIKPVGKRGAQKTKRSLDDPDLTPKEFMERRDKKENFRPGR